MAGSGARRPPGASAVPGWDTVTPRTVEETGLAGLLDAPALQHLLRQSLGGVRLVLAPVDDHVENRSIYNVGWRGFPRSAVVAWLDEACFVGGDDGLDAVTAAEFEQDV